MTVPDDKRRWESTLQGAIERSSAFKSRKTNWSSESFASDDEDVASVTSLLLNDWRALLKDIKWDLSLMEATCRYFSSSPDGANDLVVIDERFRFHSNEKLPEAEAAVVDGSLPESGFEIYHLWRQSSASHLSHPGCGSRLMT